MAEPDLARPQSRSREARALAALGDSLRRWRKLRGITAEQVAERARTTRVTLRKIENGGSVSSDILMRVIMVLGIEQGILDAAEPLNSDVGRLRADELLGERVRPRR
ncbi:helix-turn-helix domain-containing protein [Pseudoclavibacter sp. RFBB5]|uniref:helix-turn-helix domain-containing protein n=1 Tax=Pseudoclavibacter sp. RFBB5 TaxID=2080574 RepID=UPI000CE7352D|nr:helix-turn-helix transcriptional regulator [Pseudoclavibacter sp. RFBB5]PPG29492.1 transcriptional regulator [Pseudoclavibacter sp. RFBB5]